MMGFINLIYILIKGKAKTDNINNADYFSVTF